MTPLELINEANRILNKAPEKFEAIDWSKSVLTPEEDYESEILKRAFKAVLDNPELRQKLVEDCARRTRLEVLLESQMIFSKKIEVNEHTLNVTFDLEGPGSTDGILQVPAEDFEENRATYIVIKLIELINSEKRDHHIIYKSATPYWLFHDICHALFTPELFIPKVITIDRDVEKNVCVKGIELARKYELPEKYLNTVPQIKELI